MAVMDRHLAFVARTGLTLFYGSFQTAVRQISLVSNLATKPTTPLLI
jgi:hypothetical protein